MRYLCILFLIALLVACGTPSAVQPTIMPQSAPEDAITPPTAAPVALETATDAPTPEVLATLATDAPTDTPAPEPTSAPAAAPAPPVGAAPKGSDCPDDHPVKGNIRDRNPNKGEKIYHVRGDNGYAQTKPERCFADVAEAVAAGYRAVK